MTTRRWTRILPLSPAWLYLALSVAMTWPLAAALGARVPMGAGSDVWVHLWTFWWLKNALLNGWDPLFTPLLFHPTGVSLTSHNIAWLNFALWFPLQATFGNNAAYSLTFLLLFTLNAYAMYLLAAAYLRRRGAAWMAGLVYGFWPYTLSESDHPNMLTVAWLPLALLYVQRAVTRGAWRDSLLAALFLALLGISRWQLLIMAVPVLGLFLLYLLLAHRLAWRRQSWVALLRAGSAAILLMAPFALPVIHAQLTRPFADDLMVYEPSFSSDLLGYIIPHQRNLLWSSLASRLPERVQFGQEQVNFLGYGALALAGIGLAAGRRRAIFWLLMALALMILALGPRITIGGQAYPSLPTPYPLVEEGLLTRVVRRPHRYNVFLGLPIALLAGFGAAALRQRLGPRRTPPLLAALSLLILAESCLAPYPLTKTTLPDWYHRLAQEPEHFAILDLPIAPRQADKFYMYYQTHHGKPLVGGHVSRQPRETIIYMVNSPFLDDLLFRREMNPALLDVSRQLRYLADANVRYLILHKEFATEEQIEAWKDWLTVRPRYEDEETVVYTTTPRAGSDFERGPWLTGEIGLIRAGYGPSYRLQGDLVPVDVRWTAAGPPSADFDVCARLAGQDGTPWLLDCFAISPDWPTSRWQADEVVRGEFLIRIPPHQPPAAYELELLLRETGSQALAGQPVSLGPLVVAPLPRRFHPPTPGHAADLRLGDDIYLHGYDLARAETLRLTLYWQALRRMDRSYKVFVHLVDPATGAILAQHDAAPRQWRYPTTWWERGEIVDETIELPVEAEPDRPLLLLIGMYDELTGERLPVVGRSGERYKDNAFLLPLQSQD
ncbi:MAG TPA: hypothetical protein VNK95_10380 [Caldilineaceae bacterium]|nr:hypothetical protein [Caldilineaceae bacterium]